ncbi:MAG: adenylate/guanylate cyclase domain-containing protein [Gammaproteobacteria bacterium]
MQCPKCKADVPGGMKFCGQCAASLARACEACGFDNPHDFRFCGSCGERLADSPRSDEPENVHAPVERASDQDAERRHVTVMFCDIVGSTELSQRLDPEDLRTLIREYQGICARAAGLYKGYVAQYLGDGVMVYFGFPQAQENDAIHAVLAGLEIIEQVERYGAKSPQRGGTPLRIRIGVHTGLVVAGAMGEGESTERLAVGDVPNIASALESVAEPNTLVVSERTEELVRGYFNLESLGGHRLHGVAEPVPVFRVTGGSGARNRLEASSRGATLTPIVGRDLELAMLAERWQQARAGNGQAVVVTGEAGIGKTRLVEQFKDTIRGDACTQQDYRCSDVRQNSILYPSIDLIHRWLDFADTDSPQERFRKLEDGFSGFSLPREEVLPLLAGLLGLPLPDGFSPPMLSPKRARERTLELLRDVVWELAESQPVLLIVDDLHWVDPTTLELLESIIDECQNHAVMVIALSRPEFLRGWVTRAQMAVMTLTGMTAEESAQLIRRVSGEQSLPRAVINELLERTDGVPLYIEELTKLLMQSGSIKDVGTGSAAPGAEHGTIPHTLQHALMARLDQQESAKRVAQLGSAIGRQFSYTLLRSVADIGEDELRADLARLEKSELLYRRGAMPNARYVFKHALIQDAAYQSLLRSRRQQIHRRIAETLVAQHPEMVDIEPETFAHHYTEAGEIETAVEFWLRAGSLASSRSANADAINHLRRGLDLLTQLPTGSGRDRLELALQTTLGPLYIATRGFASQEVADNYARAKELSVQLDDTHKLFGIMQGQLWHQLLSARYDTALAMGERLADLGAILDTPEYELETNRARGMSRIYVGRFTEARQYLGRVLELYDPAVHAVHAERYASEPGIIGQAYLARTEWFLGYADIALKRCERAIEMSASCEHQLTTAQAMCMIAILHHVRGEVAQMQSWCEKAIAYSREHGFPYFLSLASILQASVQPSNDARSAIKHVRQCLSAYREIGAMLGMTQFLAILAHMHIRYDDYDGAGGVVEEALAFVAETGETYYLPEVHRLQGLVAAAGQDFDAAEQAFERSLAVAGEQQARSWELLAATSLAAMWRDQGKVQQAHDVLAPVFGWFTEGFGSAPLVDARLVLDDISSRLRASA